MRKVLFILGDLSDTDVDWIASNGRRMDLTAGDVLIQEGQDISHVFIVIDGMLAVRTANGVEIARLQAGEIVGELSFLDSRPPNATVTAIQPTRVFAIPRPALSDKLKRDTAFSARFYRALGVFLASRLRQTMGRMGFGEPGSPAEEEQDADELDLALLDQTALAAARFDHLLSRFRG